MKRILGAFALGLALSGCMMTARPLSVAPAALTDVQTAEVEFRIPANYGGRGGSLVHVVEIGIAHERQGCPDIQEISSRKPGFVGEMSLASDQPSQKGKLPAGEPLYFYLNYKDSGFLDSARCATGFKTKLTAGKQYVVDVRVSSNYGAPRCASMLSELVEGKLEPVKEVQFALLEGEQGFFSGPSFGKNLCR